MTESSQSAHEHARTHEPHAGEDWHRPFVGLAVVAGVATVLIIAIVHLPREHVALPAIARHALQISLPTWGTTEPVNEIVYGSRGFDTFGETFILLAAVVAVLLLTRSPEDRGEYVGEASAGRSEQRSDDPSNDSADAEEQRARDAEEAESEGGEPLPDTDRLPLGQFAPERAEAMTVVVRVAARVVAVVLAVAAVYLAAWGYTPGGGFPAGAALVGVVLLLYAALGRRAVAAAVRPGLLEPVELAGAAAIITVGVVGLARKGSMFANWLPLAEQQTIRAGGTTQLFSGAELVEVATGLSIAIFALLGMEHDWAPDSDEDAAHDGDDQ
jgi:multicomponent Na+:H+ antiporter subunit B